MNYKLYFTTENPVLIPLSAKTFDKNFTSISFADCKKLNPNFAKALDAFHYALTGVKNLNDDDSIFGVKSNQGVFQRIYPPSLNLDPKGENDYILVFGGEQIPLNYQRDKKGVANKKGILQTSVEGFELEGSFITADANGFSETVFQLSLLHEEKDIMLFMDCSIRYNEEMLKEENREKLKAIKPEQLTADFRRNPANLKAIMGVPSKFENFEGDTIKMKHLPIDDYSVTAYRTITTSYGITNILTLQGATDAEGNPTQTYNYHEDAKSEEFVTKPLDVVQVWGTHNINTVLSLEPEITAEKPAILKVAGFTEGKNKNVICSLLVETKRVIDTEELDFDFD